MSDNNNHQQQDTFGSISIADQESPTQPADQKLPPKDEHPEEPAKPEDAPPESPSPPEQGEPSDPGGRPISRRVKQPAFPLAGLLKTFFSLLIFVAAIWIGGGFFILPQLIESQGAKGLARLLDRPVTLAKVSCNPLKMQLTIDNGIVGPLLSQPGDPVDPVLSFSHLQIDLAAASFKHRALILEELSLDQLFFHAARDRDGEINLSAIIKRLRTASLFKMIRQQPYSINNITISDSQILIQESLDAKPHTLDLSVTIPALANIPFRTPSRVQTSLTASFNGTPIDLTAQETSGKPPSLKITQKDLSLTTLLPLVSRQSTESVSQGLVDLDLEMSLPLESGTDFSQLRFSGSLALKEVELRGKNSRAVLPETVLFGSFQPLNGMGLYEFQEVKLSTPALHLLPGPDGAWPWPDLLDRDSQEAGPAVTIATLGITNGQLILEGEHDTKESDEWQELNLTMNALTLGTEQQTPKAAFQLSGKHKSGGQLNANGRLTPSSRAIEGEVSLKDLPLKTFLRQAKASVPSSLKAAPLELNSEFRLTPAKGGRAGLTLEKLTVQTSTLTLGSPENQLLAIASVQSSGGRLSGPDSPLDLGIIRASGLELLLEPGDNGLQWPVPAAGEITRAAKTAPTFRKFELSGQANYKDRALVQPLTVPIDGLKMIITPAKKNNSYPYHLRGSARLAGSAPLTLSGPLRFFPLQAELETKITDLPLASLNSCFSHLLNLELTAMIDSQGRLTLPEFSYSGGLTIRDLKGTKAAEEILSFSTATATDFRFTATDRRLAMVKTVIHEPKLHLRVDRHARLSMAGLLKERPEAERQKTGLIIDVLEIDKGEFSFNNANVQPRFQARIEDLSGSLNDFINSRQQPVRFSLKGRLTGGTEISSSGRAALWNDPPLITAETSITNIDLPTLAPYIEPHFGRPVAGGRLDFNNSYSLEAGALDSTTRLLISDLELDAPPKSGTAGSLANLDLLKGLLTDESGRITVEIAASARQGKPLAPHAREFQNHFRKLLLKTAVSPYSLLDQGRDLSGLGHASFESGSAIVSDRAIADLVTLALVLEKRPEISLRLQGFADGRTDRTSATKNRAALLELAEERCRTVRDILLEAGLTKQRVVISKEHKVVNGSSLGRSAARVDIELTAK